MAKQKQPHGTVAAYKRHLRTGEEPCEACKSANRMRVAKQRMIARAVASQRVDMPRRKSLDPDREMILQDILAGLRAMFKEATPSQGPAIARQIRETLDALEGKTTISDEAVDGFDELAAQRQRRRAEAGFTNS